MRRIEQLERQAREQRAQLQSSILVLRNRLTLPGLAADAAELIIPSRFHVLPAIAAAKRHPLFSMVLMTAASWLIKSGLRGASAARGRHASISRKRRA